MGGRTLPSEFAKASEFADAMCIRNRIAVLGISIIFATTLGCVGCSSKTPADANLVQKTKALVKGTSPTAGYVPDSQCAPCHQELFDSYQEVGMANSFYPPDEASRIEDFENNHYYHEPSDRHYEMTLEDGEIYQTRYQLDSAGKRINELKIRVDAILGSGNHVRSYLYRTPGGEMFQMPLAWYSKIEKWRMNPGYDRPEHFGFHRKINRECMFCHNAYPLDAPAGSDRHWEPYVFPEQLPHGIGCQRCHGPGQQHIELANQDATISEIEEAIVNPSDLSPELQGDVCLQCHLQPSSQILSEQVRADRTEYSFRPGEPLDDYRAFLDYETQDEERAERFEINGHGYRMQQSECFQRSDGKLNCVSCHDPHRKIDASERVSHYRASCLACHEVVACETGHEIETVDAKQADCVSCHMPEKRTHDVIHATMTDHKIVAKAESAATRLNPRVEPPPPPQHATIIPFGPENGNSSHSTEVYEAIAGSSLGDINAMRTLSRYVRDKGDTVEALPLAELVDALRLGGDLQGELDVLARATKLFPERMQPHLEFGMALAAAGQHEEAFKSYRRALEIGPPLPETHLGLGMSMLQRNDLANAASQFREAIKLRPWYPEALLNLGIIHFAERRWAQAREYLTKAQAADPTFVEANEYLKRIPK